jgi:hypothetical protein
VRYVDLSHLSRPGAIDVDAIRTRLRELSDGDLVIFGKQMRGLVYPLTYDGHGKPQVSAFSVQLSEARVEWRRRHPAAGTP